MILIVIMNDLKAIINGTEFSIRTTNFREKVNMNKIEVKWRLLVINSKHTVIESRVMYMQKNQLIPLIKYYSTNEIKNI